MTLAPSCHHAQVSGSAEYTAEMGAFVEAAKSAMGDLFEIAFAADSGVSAQPPAFLTALARRDAHVHQAVRGAEQLEPAAGSGVKAQSEANMLLCQSWQRHNNGSLACYRTPTLLARDDCPRRAGGRGPCGSLSEVDPLYNYDPASDKFVASATRSLQGALARDATQDAAANQYSVQWRNGLTVSDANQTLSYSLPSQRCLRVSYEHLSNELSAVDGLTGKVSADDARSSGGMGPTQRLTYGCSHVRFRVTLMSSQVVVVASKEQAVAVRTLLAQRKIITIWDMQPAYNKLCRAIEKIPTLPGLKDRFKLWCVLPDRPKEPFLLVSTLSIASHVMGPWSTPLYASLALRSAHQDIRVVPFIRALSAESVLPRYEDSSLRQFDKYTFDGAELAGLARPDPEEQERIHQLAVKAGKLGGAAAAAANGARADAFAALLQHLERDGTLGDDDGGNGGSDEGGSLGGGLCSGGVSTCTASTPGSLTAQPAFTTPSAFAALPAALPTSRHSGADGDGGGGLGGGGGGLGGGGGGPTASQPQTLSELWGQLHRPAPPSKRKGSGSAPEPVRNSPRIAVSPAPPPSAASTADGDAAKKRRTHAPGPARAQATGRYGAGAGELRRQAASFREAHGAAAVPTCDEARAMEAAVYSFARQSRGTDDPVKQAARGARYARPDARALARRAARARHGTLATRARCGLRRGPHVRAHGGPRAALSDLTRP